MEEIGNSLVAAIKKRTASATFGTYLFFWASYHWQGVYAALFVSEDTIYEKFGLLKNEYLNQRFFGSHGVNDWGFYLGLAIPALLTLVFIWPLPKFILIHLYRIEQEHKTERMRIKHNEDKVRSGFEIKQLENESKKIEAETELAVVKQEAESTDPKIVWKKEFQDFSKDPAFMSFTFILQAIYEYDGRRRKNFAGGGYFEVPGGALMIADTLGLVTINDSILSLTDKGKYFASMYPHYAAR